MEQWSIGIARLEQLPTPAQPILIPINARFASALLAPLLHYSTTPLLRTTPLLHYLHHSSPPDFGGLRGEIQCAEQFAIVINAGVLGRQKFISVKDRVGSRE